MPYQIGNGDYENNRTGELNRDQHQSPQIHAHGAILCEHGLYV